MIRWEHTLSVLMNSISLSDYDHCRAFKSNTPAEGRRVRRATEGREKKFTSRRRLESQRVCGKDSEWKLALKGWWQSLSPPSFSISSHPLSSLSLMNCRMCVCDVNVYVHTTQKLMCIPLRTHVSLLSWASRWVCKWHVWEVEREGKGEKTYENRQME